MPEQILMPELGESVHEGTVSRWLKSVGDIVKEDEPVVEIMTDKVNTELQAPVGGMLVKTTIPEGGLVEVFSEIGLIETDLEAARAMLGMPSGAPDAAPAPPPPVEVADPGPITPKSVDAPSTKIDLSGPQAGLARSAVSTPAEPAPAEPSSAHQAEQGDRKWFTPVVRAMAKEHGITDTQLESIVGTGEGGRVTKKDVQEFLGGAVPQPASAAPVPPAPAAPKAPEPKAPEPKAPTTPAAPAAPAADQQVVPLAGMRKAIADHMVKSAQVPVVSTLIEVDVTPLVEFRAANKDSFLASHGVKLTYTPFFIKALAETLSQFPMLNASLQGEQIVMNSGVHMGVAVSLGKDGDGGLIVPVIKNCHTKGLVDIARDLETIAQRARGNELGLPDIQGGTFTLTNPGSYGAILGTPMINAPQSGIAGVYGIQQKPVIVNGMIAIRSVMNIVLTYDHRLVDGLTAGRFLQAVKTKLESMDFFR